ncbi:Fur-regulated basic protein FbpA [Metabacillus fastidiosus]|uniref:Fur-regulated basic protein FbpA n=1 Tax=Metabacillus fastidiosus TaxID=1458 RepID=A0ABU6NXL2_9BACI|nr:Fur-regulated basic protein FbpA [Metabacillus fastidiosus]MEC2074554.1 Fur-regulated basic protein FbpA [Metabacillus fastidiosus]MED4401383.1 Fur-regulated basic protein FbpA [Metabacillus fastidiosus]MED4453051.1 Fur-regulated basic protein FbpA [Metabacillus fastidiosus]MED4463019.1 Fur-regulated basic protein FbpA [Metabacillus fastidiosus]MED4532353.1 Fur-regulated basic protein FbpA [Metabacillus fastidiosus]
MSTLLRAAINKKKRYLIQRLIDSGYSIHGLEELTLTELEEEFEKSERERKRKY